MRGKPHRLLELGARARNIARLERLLAALESQALRGVRGLCQGCEADREHCNATERDEPETVWEHDEWDAVFVALYPRPA